MNSDNLIKRVEKTQEERTRREKFKAYLEERANEINAAPFKEALDFWCDVCAKDWEGVGFKEVRVPQNSLWYAFYRGWCPEGHQCVRRITDKLLDPYFYWSYKVSIMRAQYADDMVTPDDPRFKELYPQQYTELVLKRQGIIT